MLLNWRNLNEKINNLTEEELLKMLVEEKNSLKRATLINRLHARYSKLRRKRELIFFLSENPPREISYH